MKRLALALAFLFLVVPFSANSAPAAASQREIARAAADALLKRDYPAEGPGAAVLVARGDNVLFRAARGEADVEKHLPLRPDSVFRLGSMTKQFAAAGLLTLVDAGKVKLDDPLSKYVPGYPGGEQITVLQLLNHTAGVRNYTSLRGYMNGPIQRELTTAQMIDVFKDEKPDFAPGSSWAYSNSGYVLVGAVIEAASGLPWYAYLEKVLFQPLGMRHTGYGLDPRFASQQVHGYSREGEKVVPMRPLSMSQPHAAGALLSNVDDLLKWNRALHEGRVLKPATYAQMITPVGKAVDPGIGYGFGLFVDSVRGQKVLRHGGNIFGFTSSMSYLPGSDITVVVLENDDTKHRDEIADTVARKLAAIALGDPYPALQAVSVDAASLKAAEGSYRFDGDVVRTLLVVDGQLTAQRGAGARVPLTPTVAGDFLYPDGFNRLRLERDAQGKVTALRYFANGDGDGAVGARTNESPSAANGLQLPRAALERLVGTYVHGDLTLKVFLDGQLLRGQILGQPPVGLRATSPLEFDVEETGASLEFSESAGPAAEATIRQHGRALLLQRAH